MLMYGGNGKLVGVGVGDTPGEGDGKTGDPAGTGVGHPDVVKDGVGDWVSECFGDVPKTVGTGLGSATPGGNNIPGKEKIFWASDGG